MHRCPYLNEDRTLAKLRAQTSALRRHGFDASLHLIRGAAGQPARQIAATAATVGADLVIVGTRGRSPAAGALLGSVTQRLLHITTCPVLVVPSPSPAGAESVEPPPPSRCPPGLKRLTCFWSPGARVRVGLGDLARSVCTGVGRAHRGDVSGALVGRRVGGGCHREHAGAYHVAQRPILTVKPARAAAKPRS